MDGVDGVPFARNPKTVDPDAGTEPLYDALRTVTDEPLAVRVPFQTWVIVWPLVRLQRAVQPLTATLPAVTVTSPWNPPCQEFTVR
jgi:hypothetical protein